MSNFPLSLNNADKLNTPPSPADTSTVTIAEVTSNIEKPALLNYFGEWPMATKKDLFNTPKTGNENFLGSFIITAILSAMGIVIIKKNNRDKE